MGRGNLKQVSIYLFLPDNNLLATIVGIPVGTLSGADADGRCFFERLPIDGKFVIKCFDQVATCITDPNGLSYRVEIVDAVGEHLIAVDAGIIKADAIRQRGVPGDEQVNWSDPALSTHAVREYLEALDEEALAETLPKRLSLTDPQARWAAAPGGAAFYAYSTNYLIDTEHGVIVDVEPTTWHKWRD